MTIPYKVCRERERERERARESERAVEMERATREGGRVERE